MYWCQLLNNTYLFICTFNKCYIYLSTHHIFVCVSWRWAYVSFYWKRKDKKEEEITAGSASIGSDLKIVYVETMGTNLTTNAYIIFLYGSVVEEIFYVKI